MNFLKNKIQNWTFSQATDKAKVREISLIHNVI